MDKKPKNETNNGANWPKKGRIKLIWIPSHSGITENESADEAAKNTFEEDINDRILNPPQDLINWLEKTDAKNKQEMWAQGENIMRFRKETYGVEGRLYHPKQK
jgi:hypothetical protein